jgi:hypothetical protein
MRDRKGMNLDWSGVKEGGRGQGAGATIRTDWGRRESIFSKRKKKKTIDASPEALFIYG